MPVLLIQLRKKSDGSAALTLVREDGSRTWQRQLGPNAAFFPHHDLTHYAVETTLGHRRGFYGLIAEGWDLADFGAPWPRGPIPANADPSELIVGFLDAERASGAHWSAAELNAQAAAFGATRGLDLQLGLTDEALASIRARQQELFGRWESLPDSETLELRFQIGE